MLETVRQLCRLQELEITLKEAYIVHGGQHADSVALSAQVEVLRQEIERDALARYDRLSQHGLGVVHVRGGLCMACNLQVVQGDLNRMRNGSMSPVCPNCGVYLDV